MKNVFLKVIVPPETEISSQSTNRGTYEQDTNSITYALGTIRSKDQGVITVQGTVSTGVNKGDILIYSSILNYTNAKNEPQSISSYLTAQVVSGRTLTASIFDAFKGLFQSGWFALLLLLIIGFLIYWIFFRKEDEDEKNKQREEIEVLKA
jgi:hypothetical protein